MIIYGVERRCNLSWNDVDDGLSRLESLLDQRNRCTLSYLAARDEVCRQLFDAGNDPRKDVRHSIFKLRRDIAKEKAILDELAAEVAPHLSTLACATLLRLLEARQALRGLDEAVKAECTTTLRDTRARYAHILRNEDFARAVQAANPSMLKRAIRYADAVGADHAPNKSLRDTEDSVTSYVYRAVNKPTPFGSFVTVSLLADGGQVKIPPMRSVRISRDIMHWIEYVCSHLIDEVASALPLRVNTTVRLIEGQYHLFSRGYDGAPDMLGGERFLRIKATPVVAEALAFVSSVQANTLDLCNHLRGGHRCAADVDALVAGLVQNGFFERSLGIPDHEEQFARHAAKVLRGLGSPTALQFAGFFLEVAEIERRLPSACAKERGPMIDELHACLKAVADLAGVRIADSEKVSAYFYEDLGGGMLPPSAGLTEDDRQALARVVPVLMLFDAQTGHRRLVRDLMLEMRGGEPVNVLDLYARFRSRGDRELQEALSPTANEEGRLMVEQRGEFLRFVENRADRSHDGVIDLTEVGLEGGLPCVLPSFACDSVSVYVQRGDERNPWVLNNAGVGFGAGMSRFSSIFDVAREGFSAALGEQLKKSYPSKQLTDLSGVIGANSNIHGAVFDRAILYPGSKPSCDGEVIRLCDVEAYCDGKNEIRVRNAVNGHDLDFVSLNFLHPAAGPGLYRFLHLFTPYWSYSHTTLADQLMFRDSFPRVTYGPLTLVRSSYRVDAAEIQTIAKAVTSECDAVMRLDRWRRARCLPSRLYFRELPRPTRPLQRLNEPSIQSFTTLRRGRLRKPHIVDFNAPLLVRLFLKQVAALPPDGIIQLQEALPDQVRNPGEKAREFMFQLEHVGAAVR